jgi:hypothetical protein
VTILRAEVHLQAGVRRRQLDRLGEVGRHVRVHEVLDRLGADHERNLEVGECLGRHAARLPDVVRHAGRIVVRCIVVDVDSAHGIAGAVVDGVQRVLDARGREVVQERAVAFRLAVDAGHIVRPDVVDVALDADDQARGLVTDVVLAATAFDVAPPDEERRRVVRCEAEIAAPGLELLRRPERIAAAHLVSAGEVAAAEKDAGGGDLRHRAVVHPHELAVHVGVLGDLVVGEDARGVALIGTLVVVQRPKL